jgi:hypothetical protein
MRLWVLGAVALAAAPAQSATTCTMSADERAWVEGALRASDHVMVGRLRLPPDPRPMIIAFNERCRFELQAGSRWLGTPHTGKIALPDGTAADAVITSFASRVGENGPRFFVMALPSLWRTNKTINSDDKLGLTGVFLHEFSHTRQMDVLQRRFEAAAAIYKMPDDFNDDSIQMLFRSDPAYAASIQQESDLLYRAADDPDPAKARELARQALALMDARQKRWFTGTGNGAKYKPYDDLFLTMEGFGQWSAYAWLSDPRGGGLAPAAARSKMRGSRKWWSQEEGLAMFLVIDRLAPGWARQAFGNPPAMGIEMLRRAVAAPPATRLQ